MTKCTSSIVLVGEQEKSEFHVLLVGTGESGKIYIFRVREHSFFSMYHTHIIHIAPKKNTHTLSDLMLVINITHLINSNVPEGVPV